MTRSRASAKAAGTRFETQVAGYLAEHVDDRIERRRQGGANDRGDISGLRACCPHPRRTQQRGLNARSAHKTAPEPIKVQGPFCNHNH